MDMKRNQDQIIEVRPLKQSSYSYRRRKECIKKKTMELATLCGINVCTIIYEPDGEVDSWPENPSAVKAIIKNFKDLTSDTFKKTTIRDESKEKVSGVPGGEVDYWLKNSRPAKRARIDNDKAHDVNQRINKIVPCLSNSSLTEFQKEELLKRLDCELQVLTNRIEFLTRADRCSDNKLKCGSEKYRADSCSDNKLKCGSEKYRIPDLNYLPPVDENECSALVPDEHGPVPVNYCLAVHCSDSSGTSTTSSSVGDS